MQQLCLKQFLCKLALALELFWKYITKRFIPLFREVNTVVEDLSDYNFFQQ